VAMNTGSTVNGSTKALPRFTSIPFITPRVLLRREIFVGEAVLTM